MYPVGRWDLVLDNNGETITYREGKPKMMFGMLNRKPQSRLENISKMAGKRWNRMMGRDVTRWEQSRQAIMNKPWLGLLAGAALFAGLAFTFGRRFMGQTQV